MGESSYFSYLDGHGEVFCLVYKEDSTWSWAGVECVHKGYLFSKVFHECSRNVLIELQPFVELEPIRNPMQWDLKFVMQLTGNCSSLTFLLFA